MLTLSLDKVLCQLGDGCRRDHRLMAVHVISANQSFSILILA